MNSEKCPCCGLAAPEHVETCLLNDGADKIGTKGTLSLSGPTKSVLLVTFLAALIICIVAFLLPSEPDDFDDRTSAWSSERSPSAENQSNLGWPNFGANPPESNPRQQGAITGWYLKTVEIKAGSNAGVFRYFFGPKGKGQRRLVDLGNYDAGDLQILAKLAEFHIESETRRDFTWELSSGHLTIRIPEKGVSPEFIEIYKITGPEHSEVAEIGGKAWLKRIPSTE